MAAESMVHALEQIHGLLAPDGFLIDIHPYGELVEFIYPLNGRDELLGYLQETDDYIEYRQADEAIQTVIEAGLFQMEAKAKFDFRNYTDSFDEMKTYLERTWSDALITDDVIHAARELEAQHGVRGIVLREQVKIRLLSPLF